MYSPFLLGLLACDIFQSSFKIGWGDGDDDHDSDR